MMMNRRYWMGMGIGIVMALAFASGHGFAAEGPAAFKVSEFEFKRPEAWEWVPSRSSMRAAQMKVTDKESKEPGEVVFFYFGPGNGGGTEANVQRWFGQFQEPKSEIHPKAESETIEGHKVTWVSAQGTYMAGMPFGPKTPKPGFALLAAIVEHPKGNVFVKMTAPKELTLKATETFKKMVASGLKD